MTKPIIRVGKTLASRHPLEESIIRGLTTHDPVFRDRSRLHAGDVAWCPRRAVLYHYVSPADYTDGDAPGKFYMSIGNAIHGVVTTAMFAQQLLLFKEYKIPEMGLGLGGKIDAIVLLDDKIRIVEIKSCGSQLPKKVKPEHRAQASVYSVVTGIPALVLYVSRSVADWSGRVQMVVLDCNLSDEDLKHSLMSVILASLYSKAKVLPRIPAHITSEDQCKYCPFAEGCWADSPLPLDAPDPAARVALVKQGSTGLARLWADREARTHGVLKFIQDNGTTWAKAKLAKLDWDDAISF